MAPEMREESRHRAPFPPALRRAIGRNRVALAVFGAGVVLRGLFMVAYRPAFLGIADAGSYVGAAHHGLFSNVYDPGGYPLFIRVVDAVDPRLSPLIALQHGLGVGTATIWYLAVRRATGSSRLGLIPATLVLFDGYGLWVEHTPITETLFSFLVAAVLYLVAGAPDAARRGWQLVAAGLLIGVSATVRPLGAILIVIAGAWILWTWRGSVRRRLGAAAVLAGPALVVIAAYVVVQHAETGFTGLTQDTGRVLYAQAARFADCADFTPPPRTAVLCETTPKSQRGSFNQYLTGAPDADVAHFGRLERQITGSSRAISPAWRRFGPPPAGNAQLQAFGLSAIVQQPLDYLSEVVGDFHYYWSDDHRAFITAAARVDPDVEAAITGYYRTGAGVSSHGLGLLRWYGETVEVTGLLMIALLLLPMLTFLEGGRRARHAGVLFAAAGWLLPVAADAAASVDPRFMLPAYGPLAAAIAIGFAHARRSWPVDRLDRAAPSRAG